MLVGCLVGDQERKGFACSFFICWFLENIVITSTRDGLVDTSKKRQGKPRRENPLRESSYAPTRPLAHSRRI